MKREHTHTINGALCIGIGVTLAIVYREEGEWAPLLVWPLLVVATSQLAYGLWLWRWRPTPDREFARSDFLAFLAVVGYVAGSDGPLDDEGSGYLYDLVHDTVGKEPSGRHLRRVIESTRLPPTEALTLPDGGANLSEREKDMALLLAGVVAGRAREQLEARLRVVHVAQVLERDGQPAAEGIGTAATRWSAWMAREETRCGKLARRT